MKPSEQRNENVKDYKTALAANKNENKEKKRTTDYGKCGKNKIQISVTYKAQIR